MRRQKQLVRIRLESRQEDEQTIHEYEGEWIIKGRSSYLLYEESDEGGQSVKTTIRIGPNELSIVRRGAVVSEQRYVEGLRQAGEYSTKGLRFRLETETEHLSVTGAPAGEGPRLQLPLDIAWSYTLWMDEQHIGRFELRLYIQEVD